MIASVTASDRQEFEQKIYRSNGPFDLKMSTSGGLRRLIKSSKSSIEMFWGSLSEFSSNRSWTGLSRKSDRYRNKQNNSTEQGSEGDSSPNELNETACAFFDVIMF